MNHHLLRQEPQSGVEQSWQPASRQQMTQDEIMFDLLLQQQQQRRMQNNLQNQLQHQLQHQQNQLQAQFQAQQQRTQHDHQHQSFANQRSFSTEHYAADQLRQQRDLNQAREQLMFQQAMTDQHLHVSGSAQGSRSAHSHDLSTTNNQPKLDLRPIKPSNTDSANVHFPLALPEDEEWLTPLHCFVRKYCVEAFVATNKDVAAPCMGKRTPVSIGQVGIRCHYCSPDRLVNSDAARSRENGVVYPSTVSRIYNSSINLLQRHLRSCPFVPPEVLAKYEDLKASNARSGASKKFWSDSAQRLGLRDAPDGIRLDQAVHRTHRFNKSRAGPQGSASGNASSLANAEPSCAPVVTPSDKRSTTSFTYHLMLQTTPCVFTEADRLGRRRSLMIGFSGLACRHCFGVYGSGRFFPSSVKTMADASKTLDVLYKHVMRCTKCPDNVKTGLMNLREIHDAERSRMPFGSQRAFFVKVWNRLHSDLAIGSNAATVYPTNGTLPHAMSTLAYPSVSIPPRILEDSKPTAVKTDEQSGETLQRIYAGMDATPPTELRKLANEAA